MKKIFLFVIFVLLFSISVKAELLRFSMVNQDPDPVLAGDVVELRFKVENLWEDTKNDVSVEIKPDYPFSMYESSSVKYLGKVVGREEGSEPVFFDFKLKVDQDAVDGIHEIVLYYYGSNVVKLEKMFYVDIENEKISVKPYISSSDFIVGGKSGKFTVEIANRGGKDVEALELELSESKDYKLLSTSNYVYIGDLKTDDTESEDFTVYVGEGVQQVNIPLKLKYEVSDKDYEDDFNLVLNLLTEDEAERIGLVKKNYTSYIAAVFIAAAIVFFVIRKIRKR